MIREGYFDKVYYCFWHSGKSEKSENSSNVRANIFAIHGLGGHSLWFDTIARQFNENNINFFSYDLPGFGQSKYTRGKIDSYKTWISVSCEVLKRFLFEFNVNKPVFILGHSMGALIAILMSKKVRANGWVLSVPAFDGNNKTWPAFSFVLPVLLKAFVDPSKEIVLPYGPETITKCKEMQEKIKKDKLRVVNVDAIMYKHVFFLSLAAKKIFSFNNEPVLMLLSGQDVVCSNDAMNKYYEKISSGDKTKLIYDSAFHDLFIEEEALKAASDIAEWVKAH